MGQVTSYQQKLIASVTGQQQTTANSCPRRPHPHQPLHHQPGLSHSPPSPAEVKAVLAKLKNGKASDRCSFTAEMQKAEGENITLWLAQIGNRVWVSEALPDTWRWGIRLLFWKHKRYQLTCSNHRSISLLSTPRKLFPLHTAYCTIAATRVRSRQQRT